MPEANPAGQMAADPLMVMMAPLVVLVAFSYGRRYRKDGLPQGLVVLVMMVGLGLAVTSCIPIPTPTPTPTFTPTPTATETATPTETPTPTPEPVVIATIIDYGYDPLYRLIAADYDSGEFFHYAYDPVGNRLRQETHKGANLYAYDAANRLIEVDGVAYAWDANGNLLDDGERTYAYDHANRLISLSEPASIYSYAYNGLGDRLQQIADGEVINYALDLNNSLTHVLNDKRNAYVYGIDRFGEWQPQSWKYHLGDALGSVRQLTSTEAVVNLAQSYEPFGNMMHWSGRAYTIFQFTGEQRDRNAMTYLRARYYDSNLGRFISKDTWEGDYQQPISYNLWVYAKGNPIMYKDPTGNICLDPWAPSGIHFDPNRGCDYPEASKGSFWWRKDPLGENTAIIDMPWLDEMAPDMWNKYPNSCGAAALFMFLRGEKVPADFETLVEQLQGERPGGYDGFCCRQQITGADGNVFLPTPTPDAFNWCNSACVSAETLAIVARKYYGLDIISGDNWTHEEVYRKVRDGHPVMALIRSELSRVWFGHFVVIRGFIDGGWTVVFNDSYPGEAYWDVRGGSAQIRSKVGEGRKANWREFDASWASAVDRGIDPLSLSGHIRWAMARK